MIFAIDHRARIQIETQVLQILKIRIIYFKINKQWNIAISLFSVTISVLKIIALSKNCVM